MEQKNRVVVFYFMTEPHAGVNGSANKIWRNDAFFLSHSPVSLVISGSVAYIYCETTRSNICLPLVCTHHSKRQQMLFFTLRCALNVPGMWGLCSGSDCLCFRQIDLPIQPIVCASLCIPCRDWSLFDAIVCVFARITRQLFRAASGRIHGRFKWCVFALF